MALNIITDKAFDEALHWLAKKEKKTKSDIIRDLVVERCLQKKGGFHFGSLASVFKRKKPTSAQVLKELKQIDNDHDLD